MIPALARHAVKHAAGRLAGMTLAQCDYGRAAFIFGHMRCGSTALSNILCSRAEISGYGEAHVAYAGAGALGRLAINQQRRGAWKPGARYLFDKVLHSRYDAGADPALGRARAIFLVRDPAAAILSIRTLFSAIGSAEYATDALAADYYEERVETLARLWQQFEPDRRFGTSHAVLTGAPDDVLARVSGLLALDPPLANSYAPSGLAARHGAGDPLSSHRFSAIVPTARSTTLAPRALGLTPAHMVRLERLYMDCCALFRA